MPLVSRSSIKPPSPQETLTEEARVRWDLIVAAIALGVIIIDQITKALVLNYFKGQHADDTVHIIGNILTLENLGNRGAAFSSFTQSPGVLAFLILVAIGVIGWMYWSTRPRNNPWLKATFGLIIGGALGNLLDRVRLGYVVDFVHFQIPAIHFDFAVFNMADSAISIGVVALAIIFWTLPRENAEDAAEKQSAPSDVAAAPKNAAPVSSSASAKATVTNSAAPRVVSAATKTPTNPVNVAARATTTKPSPAPKAVTAGSAARTTAHKSSTAGKSKRKRH